MKPNKTLAAIALALTCAATAMAEGVSTPYSMYGYGILGDNATSMQRQMGGIGYAMNSGRQINVMNPASYASIDSLTFLWDMGADLAFIHSRQDDISENHIGGGLGYLTMQFPLGKHFGGSAGLLPVTSVGYAFGNEIKFGTVENQGYGGINQLYIGLAGQYAGFGLGVNVSYMFGNIVNDVYSSPAESNQSLFEHVMQIRDWNISVGAQYTASLTKYDRMTIGVTYSPKKTFLGKTWVTNQNMAEQTTPPDTVAYMKIRDNYYRPHSIGAGLSYTHSRQSHFMAEVDFTYQNWEDAKYSPMYSDKGELVFKGMHFDNRYKIAAGAEFSPKLRGNYFQRMRYRIGGHYTNDYLKIHGNTMKEYGISCGFGFPTAENRTVINLGFEWNHRTSSPTVMITENYFNITLGVNFNELWFWQRKIK